MIKQFSKTIFMSAIGILLLGCQPDNDNDTARNLLLLLALQPQTSAVQATPQNIVQNVRVTSSSTRTATVTWDELPGAIVYNVYYTCSPNPQAQTIPGIETVADPTIATSPTGAVTSNGVTTGTEACSSTGVNVFRRAEKSPVTINLTRYGIPYKFIVTGIISATVETAPSAVASLTEVIPTQAQRLRGIYMVGGLASSYATSIGPVDLFDQDTSTWFPGFTTIPTPVSFAGIGSERSRIVVVGGFDSTGAVSNLTQVYDILTDTWANRAVGGPSSRANIGVAGLNGRLYFLGGTTTAATAAYAGSTLTDIYDVTTNTWTAGVSFGPLGSDRASTQIKGVIYNNGGRTAAAAVATTHDGIVIGPAAGLTAGNTEVVLSTARGCHSLVSYSTLSHGSEMWTIGGLSTLTGSTGSGINAAGATVNTPITTVQTLGSPFSAPAVWNAGPTLATATACGGAVVDPRNGDVYYGGGNTSTVGLVNTGVTTFLRSNIVTKPAWTTLAPMPRARWGHSAIVPVL